MAGNPGDNRFGGTPGRLPGVPTGQTPLGQLDLPGYGGMAGSAEGASRSAHAPHGNRVGEAPSGAAGEAAGLLAQGLAKVAELLQTAFGPALQTLAEKMRPVVEFFRRLGTDLRPIVQGVQTLGQGMARGYAAGGQVASAPLAAGFGALGQAMAPIQQIASTAIRGLMPFQGVASTVHSTVGALDPGLVTAMNYSLRELQAAFGLLLQPIAQELVPLFREVGGALAPAFRALQPVIAALAQAFGAVVRVIAQVFAAALEAAAPVLKVVADTFSNVVQALAPLMLGVVAVMKMFAPIAEVVFKALGAAIQWVVKAFMYLAGAILALVGATGTLDAMIKSLKPPDEKDRLSGLAAVSNPVYQSFSELGRNLALSAAISTGGATKERSQSEYLSDITTMLESWKGANMGEIIYNSVLRALQAAASGVGEVARGVYEGTADVLSGRTLERTTREDAEELAKRMGVATPGWVQSLRSRGS